MQNDNLTSEGSPYELCRKCGCRRDRMIHSPGYSCEFEPSGVRESHPADVSCNEQYCIPCGRPHYGD